MTAVGEPDLAIKCLDFCQTLNSQGNAFKFSLTLASGFSVSFDSKEPALENQAKVPIKKKPSPSTIRRNARRKEEFLKKKLNFVSPSPSALNTSADETPASTPVAASSPTSYPMAASSASSIPPTPPSRLPNAPEGWEPRQGFRGWRDCPKGIVRRPGTKGTCGFGLLYCGGTCTCGNDCTLLNSFERISWTDVIC